MAYITKRGNSYSVRYTYEDEHGKSYDKWESFPTKEEATSRKKQIEHELAAGTFLIPSSVTVAEFLIYQYNICVEDWSITVTILKISSQGDYKL